MALKGKQFFQKNAKKVCEDKSHFPSSIPIKCHFKKNDLLFQCNIKSTCIASLIDIVKC